MTDLIIQFIWLLIKIVIIIVPVMLAMAYLTYAERKVIGYMQCRLGPNRVGPIGLLQPFADAAKLLFKEIIVPTKSNHYLFIVAPVLSIMPAIAAWAVVPFMPGLVLANINAGVLYIFAMSSIGIYGILIAGWASNSKYPMLSAMRSAAQTISYEIAMGFSFVGVLLAAGSLNLEKIVNAQQGGIWHWYALPLLPLFVVYWISAVAETNRAPFDVAEGESEIVAGFHVEYAGTTFMVFFLAEYINMILVSAIGSVLFLGGWLSPFEHIPLLAPLFSWIPGVFWLFTKMAVLLFLYLWLRATFPRFRYDQIMRLGWKILIPVTIVWLAIESVAVYFHLAPWFTA